MDSDRSRTAGTAETTFELDFSSRIILGPRLDRRLALADRNRKFRESQKEYHLLAKHAEGRLSRMMSDRLNVRREQRKAKSVA